LTRWRFAAATDTGLVRDSNQDAVYADNSLALVADGMGGHAAGEVASILTIDVVRDGFHENSTIDGLRGAIDEANRAIIADARENPDRFGMGTTVIAVGLTHDDSGTIFPTLFNVGDSRAYQLRDGALRQLSEDHSVAEEWVRMGRLTPEEAATHPRRHQLTRALGVEDNLEIDVLTIDAIAGDRILLCSDGLSNELSADALAQMAGADEPLEDVVNRLVASAREAGGRDNISAVLIEFDEVTTAPKPVKKTVSSNPPPLSPAKATLARPSRRRRRLTWRVWAAAALVVVVGVGFVTIMHWYAYSTYYLSINPVTGKIAVYQGQSSGVLWYHPVLATDTQFKASETRPADYAALQATIGEPTLGDALSEAASLHKQWQLGRPGSVTTTTLVSKG
jgi:PPM family protein phosphatase